ncbi:MAG: site-specific integrase [Bacteroidetes bacterium]|nr:site-specific integrase [Bacteroidota bacterium]
MREIKKHVRYYVQKRNTWEDQSPTRARNIVMMFNYDGKRLCTLTGMKSALVDFDEKRQRVKLNVKRSAEVNRFLDLLEQKVNDIYFTAKADGKIPDNAHILKEMRKDIRQAKANFFDEWLKFVELNRNRFATGTVKSMMTAYHRFKEFTKGKVTFDDVTPELLAKYAEFLLSVGNVNITVHGNIKRMKIFLNYAKDRGMHNNDQYKKFTVSVKESRIVFLEWEEVKKLYDYKPESEFERKVLDKFLVGALTTLRFSDYDALTKDAIRTISFEGDNRIYHAAYVRHKKTDNITVVPLLPEAMKILNRYKDQPGDLALPKLGCHVLNRHIKLIAKKAGINAKTPVDYFRGNTKETKYYEKWELIGTHTGRKSFISHAIGPRKIAATTVAEIAGQNVKTTQKFYAGVVDRDKFVQVMKDMRLTTDELGGETFVSGDKK